jgi:hypothetical protein
MRSTTAAALAALALIVSSCGGGDADTASSDTTAAAAEATTTTAADTAAESSETTSSPETTAAPVAEVVRPTVTGGSVSAGPIGVTSTPCTIDGVDFSGTVSPASLAFAGSRAFVATETGVAAFTVSSDGGCTFTLDTTVGTGGYLLSESVDSLSGASTGRLLATDIFGTTVFDVDAGLSYACDGVSGDVAVSADGTQALTWFPGSPVERWELTDTICNSAGEVPFPDLADVKWISYSGTDLLVGGEGAGDEVVYATRYRDGAPAWKVGTAEIGAPGWFGWIHGMNDCGSFTCAIDTNTFQLALVDGSGALAASFDVAELTGGTRGWIEPIVTGPDGAAYVLLGTSFDAEDGTRTYFGDIVRLDITG